MVLKTVLSIQIEVLNEGIKSIIIAVILGRNDTRYETEIATLRSTILCRGVIERIATHPVTTFPIMVTPCLRKLS